MPPPLIAVIGPAADTRAALTPAFTVAELPADALVLPEAAAAVVVVVSDVRAAVRQTRRWRADLREQPVPILWVLPDDLGREAGLDAGADVCLGSPVEPAMLAAQVRAAVRQHTAMAAIVERAADARTLNDRLRRAYDQLDADGRFSAAVVGSLLPPRLESIHGLRFTVAHGTHGRPPGTLYHAACVGPHQVGVLLADLGTAHLGILGPLVRLATMGFEWATDGPRVVPPAEVLARVNRAIVGLSFDPPVLVSAGYAVFDQQPGRVQVARGGQPPAVHLPADVELPPSTWTGPGPYLGSFEAEFLSATGHLHPGDRLVLHTAGRDEYVMDAAAKYRDRTGQEFADLVAREGLAPFPGTVVVVEQHERQSERPA